MSATSLFLGLAGVFFFGLAPLYTVNEFIQRLLVHTQKFGLSLFLSSGRRGTLPAPSAMTICITRMEIFCFRFSTRPTSSNGRIIWWGRSHSWRPPPTPHLFRPRRLVRSRRGQPRVGQKPDSRRRLATSFRHVSLWAASNPSLARNSCAWFQIIVYAVASWFLFISSSCF